jgi:hypothetical protein
MDELLNRWFQAGSLFIQAGFLIAAVWSVRAILRSLRASQVQMGALLQLTVSGTHSEENARTGPRPTPYLLDGWPEASQHAAAEETIENPPNRRHRERVWAGLVGWLQQPMAGSNLGMWRRMVRWLQAPART